MTQHAMKVNPHKQRKRHKAAGGLEAARRAHFEHFARMSKWDNSSI
jgi:hypothetical protein